MSDGETIIVNSDGVFDKQDDNEIMKEELQPFIVKSSEEQEGIIISGSNSLKAFGWIYLVLMVKIIPLKF